MVPDGTVPRKYIMGWLKLKPGKRDEFMALYRQGAEATRREPGCVFYDCGLSTSDPDTLLIMECFASEEAHAAHLDTPHFKAMWAGFRRLGTGGEVVDVWSTTSKTGPVSI